VGFPQPGLYDARPASGDVIGLIVGLKALLLENQLKKELFESGVWALSKSRRVEAFDLFRELFEKQTDLKSFCEENRILGSFKDFLERGDWRVANSVELAALVTRLETPNGFKWRRGGGAQTDYLLVSVVKTGRATP
jgi:hypothetical protein